MLIILIFPILAPMISLVVRHLDYFWTLILGNTTIATALYLMSWITRDDIGMATIILCMYETLSTFSYHKVASRSTSPLFSTYLAPQKLNSTLAI